MARGYTRAIILASEEKEARKGERVLVREIREAFDLPVNEFLENYKLSKEMVQYLCTELREDLAPKNDLGYPIHVKVLSAMKILIDGHYQRGMGQEATHCVGQTTVSKYLEQFVTAVNTRLKPKWIKFPGSPGRRHAVSSAFEAKLGVPNILGAIDCTQVKIFPPDAMGIGNSQYRNRHGDMSINVQLVADVQGNILNCNANYPGRCHDQFIFNNSILKEELKRLYNTRTGNYFLLGDSGYALEPWIMTPIRDAAPGTPEERYTNWHCKARNIIERTNGYLKGTFRSLGLDRRLHYEPNKAAQLIYASCTLYNIMKHYRVPLYEIENGEVAAVPEEQQAVQMQPTPNLRYLQVGQQKRQQIINSYFTYPTCFIYLYLVHAYIILYVTLIISKN